ncbi:MAG TPA: arginine--tRNA ligase [Candidatus Deferrimicrobium sp.]|nr:arginine--tRNA ligase [Candidatus Deferrimicrobium sp.]
MKKDRFKEQVAATVAAAFRSVYEKQHQVIGSADIFDPDFIYEHLEKPKDPQLARFALPVHRYAGMLKESPDRIAEKVAHHVTTSLREALESAADIECDAVRGYLNARVNFEALARETISEVLSLQNCFGGSDEGSGKKVLIEYSSPNIAKPFGVGHLRSTILGHSLRRIFEKLGYEVVGLNHLGDWGTQFGKMIIAYGKWGREVTLDAHAIEKLQQLYVRFHTEAETDDSLNEEARAAFKRLEDGEPEATELWERFKSISQAEFNQVYQILGVSFDYVHGESFYNDKMESLIGRLQAAGLTRQSEGALIVDLNDPQLPPCLLKKADGATLYSTRDLAGLVYRWKTWRFHELLYVVGSAQKDHFKQIFRVIDLLEDAAKVPAPERMSGRAKHVDFGWILFGEKTMSTRRGNIVVLTDVLTEAVKLAEQRIREKNPELLSKQAAARTMLGEFHPIAVMIGVGAVIFSQLSVRRHKDVNFDWDEVLNFEGETGPYLQYTHARLCSLLRHYGKDVLPVVDYSLLKRDEEERVVELLADFPQAIGAAAENYDPYFISAHLLKLASAFNKVYQRKDKSGRIDKIVSENLQLSAARAALVKAVQTVLQEGLYLLGLQAPEEM